MTKAAPRKLLGIFNPRPLAIGIFYLAAGILLAVYRPPFVAVWYCILALSALYLYVFKLLKIRSFILVLVCICISLQVFAIDARLDKSLCFAKNATVEGRVLKRTLTTEGTDYLLDDLIINGENYSGKLRVTLYRDFECGDRITLSGTMKTYSFTADSYALKRITSKEYYDFSATFANKVYEQGLPLRERILDYVKTGIAKNADYQTAAFTMSVLFGDSGENQSLSAYRETNLAHLFAVSGLHVATLTAVLYFILIKVFRRKKTALITFATVGAALTFYAYLCGFTPSVVRALLMTVVAGLSTAFGFYRDRPSILAAAAIISLCVRPLWLFDASFLLSYSAVLGIILLQPVFERLFAKAKMPERLKQALSLNMAVSAAVMPVSAYYFGTMSFLSLPLSLVFIPFVSLLFVGFGIVAPFAGLSFSTYPLIPLSLGVKLCDYVVELLDQADAYFHIEYGVLSLAFWFVALFLISDLCLLKKEKFWASLCAFGAAAIWLFA